MQISLVFFCWFKKNRNENPTCRLQNALSVSIAPQIIKWKLVDSSREEIDQLYTIKGLTCVDTRVYLRGCCYHFLRNLFWGWVILVLLWTWIAMASSENKLLFEAVPMSLGLCIFGVGWRIGGLWDGRMYVNGWGWSPVVSNLLLVGLGSSSQFVGRLRQSLRNFEGCCYGWLNLCR